MTIILKSNKVASANVGNVHGYIGPSDYSGMLDFNRQEYFTRIGGVRKDYLIDDVVSVARDSIAESTDSLGVRHIAANNKPRLQYVPSMGLTGLFSESGRRNFVKIPLSPPASQVVSVPASAASTYIVMSAWGAGDADLSDPLLTLLGTLPIVGGKSKIYAKATGAAFTPTLTITGSVERVQVENSAAPTCGSSFILTASPYDRPNEIIKFKTPIVDLLNSGEGTVVAHCIGVDALRTGGTLASGMLYFRNTADASGGVYMTVSSSLSPLANGVDAIVTLPVGSAPAGGTARTSLLGPWQRNQVRAVGFNRSGDFVFSSYRQRNQSLATGYIPSIPNEIGLNGAPGLVGGAGSGIWAGVIARVVIYNRKLSLDEMSLVAAAWQW